MFTELLRDIYYALVVRCQAMVLSFTVCIRKKTLVGNECKYRYVILNPGLHQELCPWSDPTTGTAHRPPFLSSHFK